MLVEIKLVDGEREFLLRPRPGIADSAWDFGFPDIRVTSEVRTDDDGEDDTTSFHGASAITAKLRLYQGSTRNILDELRGWCAPGLRPYLVVDDDEWTGPRRVRLRCDQHSAPIESGTGAMRDVQLGWKAPAGQWEALDEVEVPDLSADIPSSVGLSLPVSLPVALTPTLSVGGATVTGQGNVAAHFTVRMYGPCAAPRLINETTGEAIGFTSSLVLGAGEYVEVDTRDKTAHLLSDPGISRLDAFDFTASSWWQIQPGTQQVRYAPATASAGSVAQITYRPAWL
ncbi:phage distal tail protein [Spirillospora sp. CA-253888]